MTNKQQRFAKMKHKLTSERQRGRECVYWRLDSEQLEYLARLGYEAIPSVFEIQTKLFSSINVQKSFIKTIHYAKKKGKNYIYMELTQDQVKDLQERKVSFHCLKHKIIL